MSTAPIAFLRSVACVNARYRRLPLRALEGGRYAHHPYEFRRSPRYRYPGADNATIGTLNLTRALDRLKRAGALRYTGGGRMPVYLTEFGYPVRPSRAPGQDPFALPPAGVRHRAPERPHKSQLQYLLVSPPRGSESAFFNTALISQRGTRYPQYNALQRWYRKNRGKVKRPRGEILLPPARAEPIS